MCERVHWGLLHHRDTCTHSQTHPHQHCEYSKINLYTPDLIFSVGRSPESFQTCCCGFHGVVGGGSKSYTATTPAKLFTWQRGCWRERAGVGAVAQADADCSSWTPSPSGL